jgi:hypothetical protein
MYPDGKISDAASGPLGAGGKEDHTETKGEMKMDLTPPFTVYNSDQPITPVELHEIVQDMRLNMAHLTNRSDIAPGALSLDWMGMYGNFHIVFCRDKAEADIMMARLREAGFDGDIEDCSNREPAPAKKPHGNERRSEDAIS